jgi:hypothetical protein
MQAMPQLARLIASILFIEQPINRNHALDKDVSALSRIKPVIVDESDADLAAFLSARALGYTGVSSKCCKGFYKSILNAARCKSWNAEAGDDRYFMSGEDLTTLAAGPRPGQPAGADARRAGHHIRQWHGGSAGT